MVSTELAERLSDLFEIVRNEGVLMLEEEECKRPVLDLLDDEEKIFFKTIVAAICDGFSDKEVSIVFQNAKDKCSSKNYLLNCFFDILVYYLINTKDLKASNPDDIEKFRNTPPFPNTVRHMLWLLTNNDSSDCQ